MIVADTHALLWWVGVRHLLSVRARDVLDNSIVCVAGVTVFEIASLVRRGRVDLRQHVMTWLENVFALPEVVLLPLTMDLAVTAAKLPDPIRDPMDRIIVATALHQGVPLVTKDRRIIESGVVSTIW